MFGIQTRFGYFSNCTLKPGSYANDHVAIQIMCEEGPFGTLTVNIDGIENYPKNCSCVDTNNLPEAEEIIKHLKLGQKVGSLPSGWCVYPVYQFDIETVERNQK